MSVFLADEQTETLDLAALRDLGSLVLSEEGYPESTEAALLFVNDDEMASYNERFLNRQGPTDVLAFPVEELKPGEVPDVDPSGPPIIVGDVIIAPSYVRKQAADIAASFEDEMALMVAHGVLHLIGYDHQSDSEAEAMEAREVVLLSKVGRSRR